MTTLTSFPLFAQLPAELQLRIWDECAAGPSMHVFDVCFPSCGGSERTNTAFADRKDDPRYAQYRDHVFFDVLETSAPKTSGIITSRDIDPSVWRLHDALSQVCSDSRTAIQKARRMHHKSKPDQDGLDAGLAPDINTVYLPGRNRTVWYVNTCDVLFLRFRDTGAATDLSALEGLLGLDADGDGQEMLALGNMSEMLGAQWSGEMATTVQHARRVALDIAETWTPVRMGPVIFEEIAFLACCLQKNLDVLYLVDYCAGRCSRCASGHLRARDLRTRGRLAKELYEGDGVDDAFAIEEARRAPDVINGVGVTYREVFNFEAMGWNDSHPTYLFARIISDAIRNQQRDTEGETFRGVRVLMAESDSADVTTTAKLTNCPMDLDIDFCSGRDWVLEAARPDEPLWQEATLPLVASTSST